MKPRHLIHPGTWGLWCFLGMVMVTYLSFTLESKAQSPVRRPFGARAPSSRVDRSQRVPRPPQRTAQPAEATRRRETTAESQEPSGTVTAAVEFDDLGEPLINLDFQDGDLQSILKILAELTDTNYLFDESLTGKVNLVGPRQIPLSEAVELLESILEYKGFAVVPMRGFTKIVPRQQAPGKAIETILTNDEGPSGADTMVTQLIRLEHTSVEDMKRAVAGLLSNPNALIEVPRSNKLIVTENRLNIERVMSIIRALDTPVRGKEIHIVPVERTQATTLAERLTKLLKERENEKTEPETRQNVVARPMIMADERTNSLIVVCLSEDLPDLIVLVERLDQEARFAPSTRIIPLRHAEARTMATTVREVMGSAGEAGNLTVVADERTNGLILSSLSAHLLEQAMEIVDTLDADVASWDQIVKVHHLEFAEAEHVAEVLRDFEFIPPEETRTTQRETTATAQRNTIAIRPDRATNSLIITCPRNRWPYIEEVIAQLDVVRAQVMVEALVVELDVNRARQLGLDFNLLDADSDRGNRPFALGSTGTINSVIGGVGNGLSMGILTGSTFDWDAAVSGDANELSKIGLLVRALQNDSQANILSSPQLLTSDNETASISVGEQIQIPASFATAANTGLNTITSFTTEDLGILLEITPRITKNDHVQMKVIQTVTARTADTLYEQNIPVISKRNLDTTVTVSNQSTIAIGGLISETQNRTESRIPVLSGIPGLGRLFRERRTERRKTNLMIFLTPHIIRGAGDAHRFTARQRNRLEETIEQGNPRMRRALEAASRSPEKTPATVDELVESIMGILSGRESSHHRTKRETTL